MAVETGIGGEKNEKGVSVGVGGPRWGDDHRWTIWDSALYKCSALNRRGNQIQTAGGCGCRYVFDFRQRWAWSGQGRTIPSEKSKTVQGAGVTGVLEHIHSCLEHSTGGPTVVTSHEGELLRAVYTQRFVPGCISCGTRYGRSNKAADWRRTT